MYDSEGMFLGNVPQGREERYGFPSILTARWDIHETLLDEATSKGIEVIYGAKVREVVENDASVTVRWTEGDEKKQADSDLIVGADGIWSSVRNRSVHDCTDREVFELTVAHAACMLI